jgi:hypothetical protein
VKTHSQKFFAVAPALTGIGIALGFLFGNAAGIGVLWGVFTGSQVFLSYWALGKLFGGAYGDGVQPPHAMAFLVGFALKGVCIGIGVPLLRALGEPATPAFCVGLFWVYSLAIGWVISRRDS